MAIRVTLPTPAPNASVPVGHRAKCRGCGAVDNIAYRGVDKRKARCGACGSTLARRRAPRRPNVRSWVVVLATTEEHISDARRMVEKRLRDVKLLPHYAQLLQRVHLRLVDNEQSWSKQVHVNCDDRHAAESCARRFVVKGPVARSRVAQVVEMLDNEHTGNVSTLRWDNWRTRTGSVTWTGGCEGCKGRGVIAVRIPGHRGDKSLVKFVACEQCRGLGGELTREVTYRRLRG